MTDWAKLRSLGVAPPAMDTLSSYGSMQGWGGPAIAMPIDTGALQNVGSALPAAAPGLLSGIGDWFNNSGVLGKTMADGTKLEGWGGKALNALQGIGNIYMGMKNYGLARDSFDQAKKEFDMNWGAQQKTVNAQLEDRQRARVASNPGAYQSVSDYMRQNRIGGA